MPHPDPTRVDGAGTEREAGIRALAARHAAHRRENLWTTGGGIDYPGLLIDAVALLDAARDEIGLLIAEPRLVAGELWAEHESPAAIVVRFKRERDEARQERDFEQARHLTARADARLGRALRCLFDREGLAVLAAPWDAPGVRITGCGTVVEGETLEAAVAALEAQLEACAAKEADDGG